MKYKYLHILLYDKKFISPYIEFIKNNYDENEHFFYFTYNVHLVDNELKNFYLYKNKFDLLKLNSLMVNSDKIILHGLFYGSKFLSFLLFNFLLHKKMSWLIWGGDLYEYSLIIKPSIKDKLKNSLKKLLVKRIPEIGCRVKADYEYAKEVYHSKATYKETIYMHPFEYDELDNIQKIQKECINIQIGNSGDKSNNHIELFDKLSKYKKENIKLFLVISYPDYDSNKEYYEYIIKYGNNIYGNKLVVISEFMDASKYNIHLANMDILVLNHKRQQGLGNANTMLYLENKVFIRSDITSWKFYKEQIGITIFDTKSIDNLDFNDFIFLDEKIKKNNKEKIKKTFSNIFVKELWNSYFGVKNE